MEYSNTLISHNHSGFVPGRYIANNELLTQIKLEDAKSSQINTSEFSLGLFLDQEKAYDRINLDYLHQVLNAYRFPSNVTTALIDILRKNVIEINVNGFYTVPVAKKRGLKQVDPISPIL